MSGIEILELVFKVGASVAAFSLPVLILFVKLIADGHLSDRDKRELFMAILQRASELADAGTFPDRKAAARSAVKRYETISGARLTDSEFKRHYELAKGHLAKRDIA